MSGRRNNLPVEDEIEVILSISQSKNEALRNIKSRYSLSQLSQETRNRIENYPYPKFDLNDEPMYPVNSRIIAPIVMFSVLAIAVIVLILLLDAIANTHIVYANP